MFEILNNLVALLLLFTENSTYIWGIVNLF